MSPLLQWVQQSFPRWWHIQSSNHLLLIIVPQHYAVQEQSAWNPGCNLFLKINFTTVHLCVCVWSPRSELVKLLWKPNSCQQMFWKIDNEHNSNILTFWSPKAEWLLFKMLKFLWSLSMSKVKQASSANIVARLKDGWFGVCLLVQAADFSPFQWLLGFFSWDKVTGTWSWPLNFI